MADDRDDRDEQPEGGEEHGAGALVPADNGHASGDGGDDGGDGDDAPGPHYGEEGEADGAYDDDGDDDDEDDDDDAYADDEDDDDDDVGFMDQNNPHMRRVQARLQAQLVKADEEVTLELREKDEALKKSKQKREDMGVELYSVQQQLAKLQMQLERQHDNLSVVMKVRDQAEESLDEHRAALSERQAEHKEQEKGLLLYQGELDKLNAKLKQVERYNEEMKDQIAVARRETYKAEEDVTSLEKRKKDQDILIDSLNEQLKRLHDRYALYEAQLQSQQQETSAAADTLAAAASEMEAVQFEMKQLMQQWKSSLIGVTRRDEALQQTEQALRKQYEEQLALDGELNGYKQSIKAEQERNEKLTSLLNKVRSEIGFLEKQIRINNEKRERLNEEYTMLKKSMDQTDIELQRVVQERNRIRDEVATIQKQTQAIQEEIQKLEDQMHANMNAQTTLAKSKQNTEQGAVKLRNHIRDREMEVAQLYNELSRIRVDALNTVSHNEQLKTHLESLVTELKDRDKLIEKCEVEIRRRNDEIEKKQNEVDRLNKKFDQLVSNLEDENLGPLEATIHNLNKSIQVNRQECSELQHSWIKRQTELVALVNQGTDMSDDIAEMKSRFAILKQRRLRLERTFEGHKKEIKDVESGTRSLHTDMQKLNALISQNSSLQGDLAEGNLTLETEIVARLHEHEKESVQLENAIEAIKEEKARVMQDLVEAERQIMLWEKKIQLERETQAALDPNVGAAEAKSMRKEIHRMKLRYEQLQKKQEQLIVAMENAIERRDTMANRNRLAQKNKKKGTAPTKAALKAQISDLQKKRKQAVEECKSCDRQVKQLVASEEEISKAVEELAGQCNKMRAREMELQQSLEWGYHEKNKNLSNITRYQRFAKRYQAVAQGKYQLAHKTEDLEREIAKQKARTEKVTEIVEYLANEFPNIKDDLDKVTNLITETSI